MTFDKKPIKRRKIKVTYAKKIKKQNRKKKGNFFLSLMIYTIVLFLISSVSIGFILYNKYLVDLPQVDDLQNLDIAESSVIYDREGGELYKIFKEKRTYVNFEDINKSMINALIAVEDKRYWENQGIDIRGLARAGINYILGKTDGVKGTSTLTQQLIRNTIITNERSLERKIKEIYLAYKLSSSLSKEKIIEIYLNKIEYGHNAFGIEEAAKTFFNKSSSELGYFESSILASLPKGPTYYSPYNHPERLVGYPYFYKENEVDDITKIVTKKNKDENIEILSSLTDFISNLQASRLKGTSKILICNIEKQNFKNEIRVDNDGCSVFEYSSLLHFLNSIRIKNGESYIEYQTGRKDEVLGRMLEDKYIDFEQYKEAVLRGIGYTFSESKENIKSPHFVFYVREFLAEKIPSELLSVGGLKIYTTLDPKLQEKAEEIVKKQAEINKTKYDADNAALISIDNKSGEILAMVGGKDYYDTENKGNVNIITSKLQPGSTFKSFVYSLGMYEKEIGSKTPIYDLETDFGGNYIPKNFDGKFMGKIDISTALNNSRNIPAIKMFFMAGGVDNIISFMKKLGVNSLKNSGQYGASLGLGTGEMTPLELATAYSVFANMGEKKEITPILKIVDSKGNIIEEKTSSKGEQVISKAQAYLINHILSDTTSRPSFWNNYVSLKDRFAAAKTGTSTKQYIKNGKKDIYPANLWTAGYTPQITTVAWAGNTSGEKLNYKGNGLEGAGPIWKEFMEFAHTNKEVENWKKPDDIYEVNISEVSGFLPNPEKVNNSSIIKSLFVNKPTKYDNSYQNVQVDILCNGKVTNSTPVAAIKNAVLIEFNSLSPENQKWQDPVLKWTQSANFKTKYGNVSSIVTSVSNKVCTRSNIKPNIQLVSNIKDSDLLLVGENYIQLAYKSTSNISKVDIIIDNVIYGKIDLDGKKEGSYAGKIFIPASLGNKKVNLTLRAVDNEYYSESITNEVFITRTDNIKPEINLTNPVNGEIKLYEGDYFNLKANIKETGTIKTINIKIDGKIYKTGITDRNINIPINIEKNMTAGNYKITIEALDGSFNKAEKNIDLEIMKR